MISKSLATAAILTVGLGTVAHANLTMSPPSALPAAQPGPAVAEAPARPAPKRYAEVKTLAPTTQTDADERFQGTRPAPRVIDLPRAEGQNQAYVAAPPAPQSAPQARPVAAVEEPAPAPEPVAAPRRGRVADRDLVEAPRRAERPAGYRTASWNGGRGATWKTGKNDYGFEGTFGGCRFAGFSGPGGFKLDRVCR
ncbi:hypothetical protein M446_2772 [Methylobacterium sp. 4-46]|uniref:hypothetical protein n=1 Tax=unclassified Methylobacterium TaxID=2615210 RepID=UPI000165C846|nr:MULTISPECIES: hypothetical protein [Methylobacterium]ACA17210.1 hypothetical protein M446_2772 [Methylobacterium sp. 4-46]WFT82892.1 translation initiation factor IF-2 [Methylobacterium nodulans]